MPRRAEAAFTLVEVMVSLAILATALVVLVSVTAADVREAQRAQMLNVATNLARGKLLDIEEEITRQGWQQTDQEMSGDFRDEGWEQIRWKADIRLIELPSLQNIGGQGEDGQPADAAANPDNPLTGMLSSFGLGGQLQGNEAAGAGLIQQQFAMIQEILKQSIRKITVRVQWVAFGADNCTDSHRAKIKKCVSQGDKCDDRFLWGETLRCEELVVDYYVTDPAAISRVVGGLGGAAAGSSSDPNASGNTGGNTGGNSGRATGGRTGGTGGRTGGATGGRTGGATGGRNR